MSRCILLVVSTEGVQLLVELGCVGGPPASPAGPGSYHGSQPAVLPSEGQGRASGRCESGPACSLRGGLVNYVDGNNLMADPAMLGQVLPWVPLIGVDSLGNPLMPPPTPYPFLREEPFAIGYAGGRTTTAPPADGVDEAGKSLFCDLVIHSTYNNANANMLLKSQKFAGKRRSWRSVFGLVFQV